MTKKIYLETLKSVLGRFILHYCCVTRIRARVAAQAQQGTAQVFQKLHIILSKSKNMRQTRSTVPK